MSKETLTYQIEGSKNIKPESFSKRLRNKIADIINLPFVETDAYWIFFLSGAALGAGIISYGLEYNHLIASIKPVSELFLVGGAFGLTALIGGLLVDSRYNHKNL